MNGLRQIYNADTGKTTLEEYEIIESDFAHTIPQSIPMAKALVYLHSKGKLEQVVAAINGMGTIAQIRFQREVNCNRYDELVLGIQQLLGWTDAEMDTMFMEADSAPLT